LETLYRFKREEDPENKVQIITRNGYWPKVDEWGRMRTYQSRAYAERATGDYLWQVDIDEFYKPMDMQKVIQMLKDDTAITAVSFRMLTFWGGLEYITDGWGLQRRLEIPRLFKWGKNYKYMTHEPPVIYNDQGRDISQIYPVHGRSLLRKWGIYMYHYSLVFPWQVEQKCKVYDAERPDIWNQIILWANENYYRASYAYKAHYYSASGLYGYEPSWLERYKGQHPPELYQMMDDIITRNIQCVLRNNDDIDELLCSWRYILGRKFLKSFSSFVPFVRYLIYKVRNTLNKIRKLFAKPYGKI
jgi:hypothetical protein